MAITSGSPSSPATMSLRSTSVNDVAAARHPAIAISHETDALGGARLARLSTPLANAEVAISDRPFSRVSHTGRNLSRGTARGRACETGRKGGVLSRGYSSGTSPPTREPTRYSGRDRGRLAAIRAY